VTVHFDPDQATVDSLGAAIKRLAATRPKVEVPEGCTGSGRLRRRGPGGRDALVELSREEVIATHTRPTYRVSSSDSYWMGYLGPLPRSCTCAAEGAAHAGAARIVAIAAGRRIYPLPTPGAGT